MKLTTIGKVNLERVEDGNQALICESIPIETADSDDENGMSVILFWNSEDYSLSLFHKQ